MGEINCYIDIGDGNRRYKRLLTEKEKELIKKNKSLKDKNVVGIDFVIFEGQDITQKDINRILRESYSILPKGFAYEGYLCMDYYFNGEYGQIRDTYFRKEDGYIAGDVYCF